MIEAAESTLIEEPAQPPLQAEREPRLLLAGSPFLARQLKQQLPENWRITLIFPEVDAPGIGSDFETFHGDPTSALVLQRAGATAARVLLAAQPDLIENYEICRIATQQLQIPKVIALVPSRADAGPFQELGVEVIVETVVIATAARNLVEQASHALDAMGLGHGELVEITLQGSSPVVGRRLRALRPNGWSVAAIFRGGEVLIPEADSVMQKDDRLLLVGQPERLRTITEYLRVGRAQFPLPYGSSIAGPVWGKPDPVLLHEATYLASGIGLREIALTVCGRDRGWQAMAAELDLPVSIRWSSTRSRPPEAVSELLQRHSPGCLIVPSGRARLPRPSSGLTRPLQRALREANVPVLVLRGSFPYERIVLPVFRTPLPQAAVQAAFDLSEQLRSDLCTVHVQAPSFLEEHSDDASVIGEALDELASLRRRQVKHERLVGNPLAEIGRLKRPNQLLVLSHRRSRRWRSFRPDVSAYLTQRFSSSVLVLPVDA